MKARVFAAALGCLLLSAAALGATWQQKATDPSWWPYVDAVTVPTIGALDPNYAGQPLGMTQGWWPR